MSSSALVTCTRLSPNCTKPRSHSIDTVTIHCTAGQGTAKQILDLPHFVNSGGSSCNYAVGKDGSIGLCVAEENRSWCSSHRANDHRAITIEVSSEPRHPYAVTDAAYAALLDLLEDVCRRNGIKKLVWSDNKADRTGHKNGCNMTVHRDFAAKACPGDWLYSRHGQIAAEVNRRLEGKKTTAENENPPAASHISPVGSVGAGGLPPAGSAPSPFDKGGYTVRVTATNLHIRKGPGSDKASAGTIKPGVYTIVEEADGKGASKWGRLKSGAGWIALDGVKKN